MIESVSWEDNTADFISASWTDEELEEVIDLKLHRHREMAQSLTISFRAARLRTQDSTTYQGIAPVMMATCLTVEVDTEIVRRNPVTQEQSEIMPKELVEMAILRRLIAPETKFDITLYLGRKMTAG